MLPRHHLYIGLVFVGITYLFFPKIGFLNLFLVLSSSILIDVDHYIYYVYRKKDFGLKNSYNWFISKSKKFLSFPRNQRNNISIAFCFLHGVEILLILFIFSFFFNLFSFILLGFLLHLITDLIYQKSYMDRLDKASIFWSVIDYRRLIHIDSL